MKLNLNEDLVNLIYLNAVRRPCVRNAGRDQLNRQ